MQFIVVIALLWALSEALEYGAKYACRSAKSAAVKRWNASKAKRPAAGAGAGKVGRAVGRGLGAGTAATVHGTRGFVSGAREGWPVGWQKGRDWHARRQAAKVTPLQDELEHISEPRIRPGRPADAPVPDVAPRIRPVETSFEHGQAVASTRYPGETGRISRVIPPGEEGNEDGTAPRLFARWDSAQFTEDEVDPSDITPNDAQDVQSRPDGPAATEGADMPLIDTATGGETVTYEQLIAELESITNEAAAELEDATGDAQRAKDDAQRIETMVSSLSALHLDSESLSEINALLEPAQSRLAAAEQRQAAAEQRAALAQTASEGVTSRHSAIMEHASVMADRPFYG